MIEDQFGIEILPIWHGKPGDAEGFTRDIRSELAKILLSRTGRCLAAALRFHQTQPTKQPILVLPYEENDCNAEEDAVTRGSSRSVVLFTPATRESGCSAGKPATLPHEIPGPRAGALAAACERALAPEFVEQQARFNF